MIPPLGLILHLGFDDLKWSFMNFGSESAGLMGFRFGQKGALRVQVEVVLRFPRRELKFHLAPISGQFGAHNRCFY